MYMYIQERPHGMRIAFSKLAESPGHSLDHHVIAVSN
jgi:hypothetical protein